LIWMATYLASGATTLTLLTTLPLPVYVGAHQIAGWCWVGGGVALSVNLCRRRGADMLAASLADRRRDSFAGPTLVRSSGISTTQPDLATL
jgi:hypothetical protein